MLKYTVFGIKPRYEHQFCAKLDIKPANLSVEDRLVMDSKTDRHMTAAYTKLSYTQLYMEAKPS